MDPTPPPPINSTPNSKNRTGTPGARQLPPGWTPQASTVKRLAAAIDATPKDLRAAYLTPFREVCRREGFMYRNWDTAFSNCVRKDWLGVRTTRSADLARPLVEVSV